MKTISAADIHARMTSKGGFSVKTFTEWGVPWPPPKGWRRTILDHGIPYNHSLNIYSDAVAKRAAWREKRAAKREARKAANSVDTYRRKHLVMVTKDGHELFDNVRQHASGLAREVFYHSWEWRTLRMKVIKQFNRRCMCCGASPEDITINGAPVRLVVDHIKPIANYWHLRLVPTNLQILCDECNQGKGAWDETDHRSEMERQIAEQLRDRTAGGAL
jgi:5-methylcytosine-specific restriction endonuclease McrA